jgi:simple sugar transport system permease protein
LAECSRERSGVINIALEGMMLAGAFTARGDVCRAGTWLGLFARRSGRICDCLDSAGRVRTAPIRCHRHGHQHPDDWHPGILSGALFLSSGSTPQSAKEHLIPWTPIVLAFAAVPICLVHRSTARRSGSSALGGENPEAARCRRCERGYVSAAAACCLSGVLRHRRRLSLDWAVVALYP